MARISKVSIICISVLLSCWILLPSLITERGVHNVTIRGESSSDAIRDPVHQTPERSAASEASEESRRSEPSEDIGRSEDHERNEESSRQNKVETVDTPERSEESRRPELSEDNQSPEEDDETPNLPIQRGPICYVPESGITQGRCAPHFFVIGVFKGGTTSLYTYLGKHPQVRLKNESDARSVGPGGTDVRIVRLKETNFFTMLNTSQRGINSVAKYMDIFFPSIYPSDGLITGEASPSYFYAPNTPDKLHKTFPNARLILMLRNPIDRAFSRMAHAAQLRCDRYKCPINKPNCSPPVYCQPSGIRNIFDHVISSEIEATRRCLGEVGFGDPENYNSWNDSEVYHSWNRAVKCFIDNTPINKYSQDPDVAHFVRFCMGLKTISHGLYILQLMYWLRLFSPEQLLVIQSEDFYDNTASTMKRVEQHLYLDPFDWTTIVRDKYNVAIEPGSQKVGFVKSGGGGEQRHDVTPTTRRMLEEFYAPYNAALANLLGTEVWW